MSKKQRKLVAVATAVEPTERDKVEAWRTSTALRLGFPPERAFEVAQTQVDMHDLEQLVRSGCPLETAVDILA